MGYMCTNENILLAMMGRDVPRRGYLSIDNAKQSTNYFP